MKISQRVRSWFQIDPENLQYSLVMRFCLGYLILVGIPLIFKYLKVWFEFDLRITETGDLLYLRIGLRDIVDLILTGIIFPLYAWKIYTSLKTELVITKKADGQQEIPSISVREFREMHNNFEPWDLFYLFNLFMYSMTVMAHITMNNIHGKAEEFYGSTLFSEVYFWDEYIGHLLIAIPIYCMLLTLWVNSIGLSSNIVLNKTQAVFLVIISLGSGVGIALSFVEGQCAVVLAFLNILFVGLLVFFRLKKGKEISKNPFQAFILFFLVGFFVALVIWIQISGVKPYYPYLFQFSELE